MTDDLVCCFVGHDQYALTRGDVYSVARAEQIRDAPAADGRVGLLPLGTAAVPVYRLAALLGRTDHPSAGDHHVVVTRGGGRPFGIVVDRIARATVARGTAMQRLPSIAGELAAARFQGLVPLGDQLCLVLSPGSLDPTAHGGVSRAARSEPAEPSSMSPSHGPAADRALIFSTAAFPRRDRARFALAARRVVALVQTLPSVPVPGAPPYVVAVAWWRGTVVPIVDFCASAAGADGARRYLIARCGRRFDGALVAFSIGADVVLHRATGDDRQIAAGIFGVGAEPVALLDLDRLIADAESEHAARAQLV